MVRSLAFDEKLLVAEELVQITSIGEKFGET
jgi:hypothetical protein